MQEESIWEGNPSQLINLMSFIVWGLLFFLIFPIFIIIWKWLIVKNTNYELTSQRLKTHKGILNKEIDEVELFRVKDTKVVQPFFLGLFNLSNIILYTSDNTTPIITINAVTDARNLREEIRSYVMIARQKNRVREVDIDNI